MQITETSLDGVLIVETRRFGDDRGFFTESYNRRAFAEAGIDADFVQDNHSYSAPRGTVRGLHYQAPPHAQAKLVRVLKGRIMDVAVDIRRGSPTYGRHVSVELDEDGNRQLFVPRGFLHGFVTLCEHCHVAYKVDDYYSGAHDGAVRFDDPDLGIDWGFDANKAVLSDKDAAAPSWQAFDTPFRYESA